MRLAGSDKYRQLFVTHEVAWTDPSVVEAMEAFRQILDPASENLAGGIDGTLATDFISAANLVFRPDNPGAEMYYEGGFMGGIIANNFPSLTPGEDFNAFLFPKFNDTWGAPVVGGGDLLAAFADRPEVADFVRFMVGEEANTIWAETGFIVSPNRNVDLSVLQFHRTDRRRPGGEHLRLRLRRIGFGAIGGRRRCHVHRLAGLSWPSRTTWMRILRELQEVADRAY